MALARSASARAESSVRRVLVATDRSATADLAVEWAAEMARRYGAELVVVQVLVEEGGEGLRAQAAEALGELADELGVSDARLEVLIDSDPPGAIVRAAEEADADVLVVGNVGMSGRKEFLLGNVPNRVSHNARCTVVIVNTMGGGERSGGRFFRRGR
jgi:ubiquinone biosynthesis protein